VSSGIAWFTARRGIVCNGIVLQARFALGFELWIGDPAEASRRRSELLELLDPTGTVALAVLSKPWSKPGRAEFEKLALGKEGSACG